VKRSHPRSAKFARRSRTADRPAVRRRCRRSAQRFGQTRPCDAADRPAHPAAGEGQSHRVGIRASLRATPLILYFDTSALVKLIVAEEGSNVTDELWTSSNTAASSILSYPEGRAALGAALRAGHLTPAAHKRTLVEFESIQGKLFRIAVDAQLARDAGDLAERFALRGYDAVHLASALSVGGPVTFVTWDADLRSAAQQNGCALAPPTR
jgi:hypothetical protein